MQRIFILIHQNIYNVRVHDHNEYRVKSYEEFKSDTPSGIQDLTTIPLPLHLKTPYTYLAAPLVPSMTLISARIAGAMAVSIEGA